MKNGIFLVSTAFLVLTMAMGAFAAPSADLALHKTFVSSDPNVSGWNQGLTDGSWETDAGKTFAAGSSETFPKTVTVDLDTPQRLGYVAIGAPQFGSTKTVELSLSGDGVKFAQVGSYIFSQNKAEYHLFSFKATMARYLRLTYADRYPDSVGYPSVYVFTTEVAAYAPGDAPLVAHIGPEQSDMPAPKLRGDGQIDPSFVESHESFLKRGKEGTIGVLFIGDSITHRWLDTQDLWEKYYGQYDPADFGIEGDKTQHVLWRFDKGELDGIHPKVVVLMIGTNNMSDPAEAIVQGDAKIVSEIHRRLPDTKLLLLGIFPRGAKPDDAVRAKVKGINAELSKLDDGDKTRYLDIGDKFLDASGEITKEIMPDALHPSHQGYQIWADAMQPLLDEMMKS
jgi:lysophospholipase L1-like esterase